MANLSDRATGLTNVNQINLNELSSTPSAPGAGQKKFYAKDDGKVYTLDNEGNEREVGSGSGASREIEQASHGFAVGDVLYFDGTTYAKAQADDEATAEVVGVVSSIVDTNKFVVTSSGYIEEGLSGLTAGSVYYLSASTAGLLTLTEPGVIGHVSKPMLLADSATSGYVLQYRGVLVGAVFGEDTPLNADNLTEGTVASARLPAGQYPGADGSAAIGAGYVGEVLEASGVFTTPASGARGDLASLTLSAGIWDVDAGIAISRNGATFSIVLAALIVKTPAGNDTSNEKEGENSIVQYFSTNPGIETLSLVTPRIRVVSDGTNLTVAGFTTAGQVLRMKAVLTSYSGATPVIRGIFRATRIA